MGASSGVLTLCCLHHPEPCYTDLMRFLILTTLSNRWSLQLVYKCLVKKALGKESPTEHAVLCCWAAKTEKLSNHSSRFSSMIRGKPSSLFLKAHCEASGDSTIVYSLGTYTSSILNFHSFPALDYQMFLPVFQTLWVVIWTILLQFFFFSLASALGS